MAHFSKDWKGRLHAFQTLEAAWADIQAELREGDLLLIAGAGDIEQLAEKARSDFRERTLPPENINYTVG